ncbi:hypothetical protein NRB16_28350 [Pseudomonas sp. LJDD11]|uniref:hypothetical protein n=1 Tax=unclassified Pseudomonas TaxID=196821 RepID=UPI0004F816D1|nr:MULTISPECIES: hypothetical protein [unclassified Pseudomonas]MCO8160660.1 hypothetical protein [Pseudomonas sp. 21LCFQ010]MCQ9427430.1 hypothetical protein [Pseudomonas sp. LJDD11]BAP44429.1 putative uncharacterized protein [Pseudomonas sp. StFLB209]
MTRLVLIAGLLLLQGCAVQAMRYATGAYCAAPEPARLANRILVNASIAPDRIEVTCGGAP